MDYDDFIVKQNDLNTNDRIFQKVSAITNSGLDTTIPIVFDKNIRIEINPLFFILLFAQKRGRNFGYSIDITQLDDFKQEAIQHHLRQKLDYLEIKERNPIRELDLEIYAKNDAYNDIFFESDLETRVGLYLSKQLRKDTLFVTKDATRYAINFNKGEYSQLPIMSLRGLPKLVGRDVSEQEDVSDNKEPIEKRKIYYSRVALQSENIQNITKYQKFLGITVKDFLKFIQLEEKNLSKPLGAILVELIDNIRKHTNESVDGYFSIYRRYIGKDKESEEDKNIYEYQMVIADNGEQGVLNSYLKELQSEYNRLDEAGIKQELLQDYIDSIRSLESRNKKTEKDILTSLYELNQVNHTHQIPRVAMHFGIPMLLKMMKHFVAKKSYKNILEVYTHRDSNFYKLHYDKSAKYHAPTKKEHTIKGTYVVLTFTSRIAPYVSPKEASISNAIIKNQDYQFMLENQVDIKKQINKFKVIKLEDINSLKTIVGEKKVILDAEKIEHHTFGEFIRALYLYAYTQNLKDMVVVNLNFNDFFPHLKLLAHIMYEKLEKDYDNPRNILFINQNFPSSVFIGGKNKQEFLATISTLTSHYGKSSTLSIQYSSSDDKKKEFKEIEIDSDLLYKEGRFILPFELFELTYDNLEKVDLLQSMLEHYLNEVAKKDDVHIDTGTGYHIDRYMEFKKVFEDSRWVRRLAFRLAMQFPKKPENKKYYLYGTDKYTNMLISLCYTFLDLTFERFRYKLFNIYDEFDYKALKKKIKALVEENTHEIYLVSSVLVNAKKVIELIDDNPNYEIKAIPAIQLNIGQSDKRISPLVSIKNDVTPIKVTPDKYCHKCEVGGREPLLSLAENDPFFIENTFFGTIHAKKISSYSNDKEKHVKWFDSLNFAHIERGNNHFLYYINTIKFFNQNRDPIENFLNDDVVPKIKYDKDKENIILLTSSHDTNNNFVAMVNQEVFSNDAIILSFSKTRGEANFHDLDSYKAFDWTNTRVFFVDDSIASSHTVKYFYQLLRSIPDIMEKPNIGLNGMIIMIDRISSYDETILCSYLKDSPDLDRPNKNVQEEKLERIHAFATFDIKPIKSEVEKCFLCTRNRKYLELAQKSALDLMTFQMVKRAYKIRKLEYRATPSAKERKLIDRFKTYLKAMATIYIYQKFADKKEKEFGKFDDLVQEFSDKIHDELLEDKEKRFKKYKKSIFKKIMKFQAEIAFIKALSSPRLSYYYEVRKWMTKIILVKLNIELSKTINKDFELEYIFRNDIENLDMAGFDEKDIDFLNFYKDMTNLNLVNVCWATLGYFQDTKILDTDYIQFFYKITQNKDVRAHKGDPLLHTYPFAVKFTIADNLEKARYFENNIDIVIASNKINMLERKKKNSYMNALKLENTLSWKYHLRDKYDIDMFTILKELQEKQSVDKKIETIQKIFNSVFERQKVYFFVSPYVSSILESYQSYLSKSEKSLINILDSYNGIESYDKDLIHMVKKVFYGAIDVSKQSNEEINLQKVSENDVVSKISDTWSNDYNDKYCVVRLTAICESKIKSYDENKEDKISIMENDPVWFRPTGCIVVENSSMNYSLHMDISRTILSIKNHITSYIEKKFNQGAIQETIAKKTIEDVLIGYNHTTASMLNIGGELEFIETELEEKLQDEKFIFESYQGIKRLKDYTYGVSRIAKIAHLLKREKVENNNKENLYEILKDHEDEIEKFFNASHRMHQVRTEVTFEIDMSLKNYILPLSNSAIEIIFFELFFNAAKYSNLPKSKINLYVKDDILFIENECKCKKEKHDYIGNGTAHGYLRTIFKNIGYEFIPKSLENEFKYQIIVKQNEVEGRNG